MAVSVLSAGHDLTVWNREPEAAQRRVASGAKRVSSLREAAEGSDVVIDIVSNGDASP